jgi:hypothetical protein
VVEGLRGGRGHCHGRDEMRNSGGSKAAFLAALGAALMQ